MHKISIQLLDGYYTIINVKCQVNKVSPRNFLPAAPTCVGRRRGRRKLNAGVNTKVTKVGYSILDA